jgi:hypothetical protein
VPALHNRFQFTMRPENQDSVDYGTFLLQITETPNNNIREAALFHF